MRIAQVTSSLSEPLGGAEQYCIELATWLAENGHDVTMFGTGADDRLRRRLTQSNIALVELPLRRPYQPGATTDRAANKLLFHGLDVIDSLRSTRPSALLRDGHFDVVHVHRWTGLGASILREDLLGTRTVHTVHDFSLIDTATTTMRSGQYLSRLPTGQRIRAALLRAATRHLGTAIFPTERTQARHDLLGAHIATEQTVVIPHGWRLPAAPRTVARERDAPMTFLYMGKLIEEKGVAQLLEAWGDGVDGARLRLAGAGLLEPSVRVRSGTGGIEFLGWLGKSDQASALADADALVLPSLWPENFPLVVAEALVAGVPVIATTANAPAILQDDVNAALIAPGADALRASMQQLTANPAVVRRLAAGALAGADQLDFDRHGRRVIEEYRRGSSSRRAAGA